MVKQTCNHARHTISARLTMESASVVMAAFTLFFWGITAFATVPCLQMQVLRQSAMAPNLAATLNIGAFNIGNALGAWLGGMTLSRHIHLDGLPWLAAMMTLAAIGVTFVAMRLDSPQGKRVQPAQSVVE